MEEIRLLLDIQEDAKEFDDMYSSFMDQLSKKSTQVLTDDDRDLFSRSFKNQISERRELLRNMEENDFAEEEAANFFGPEDQQWRAQVEHYQNDVKSELFKCVEQLIDVVTEKLIPACENGENKTFLYKMLGDYLRYRCEFDKGNTKQLDLSEKQQIEATKSAAELDPLHQQRLGLQLNFSVFYWEIKNEKEKAMQMADETVNVMNESLASQGSDIDESQRQIKRLLEENLEIWKANLKE